MTVGFVHVGAVSAALERQVAALRASVTQAMPGVSCVHLTDITTPLLGEGRRYPASSRIALACLQLYAAAGSGDWLFIDTDVLMRRDVREVFQQSFDVAVATREGTLLEKEVGTKFMAGMPHNKGAVFSRCPAFWHAAADLLASQPEKRQHWMGDQWALNALIAERTYAVHVLPNAFNYPPQARDEDVRDKAILHFKGPKRKDWMLTCQ